MTQELNIRGVDNGYIVLSHKLGDNHEKVFTSFEEAMNFVAGYFREVQIGEVFTEIIVEQELERRRQAIIKRNK